jgi:uncharacterized protein
MQQESIAFSNQPILELPDYRDVELRAVVPAYLPYKLTVTGGFWSILLLAAVIGPRLPFFPFDLGWWLPAIILVPGLWLTVLSWLDARKRGWAVREHDLIYRSGVIWRKTVIVPFARIQHVETSSGPIERAFDLMRVKCFTAGGMMTDLSVEGLDQASANQVRQYLLEQIRDDAGATEAGSDFDASDLDVSDEPPNHD